MYMRAKPKLSSVVIQGAMKIGYAHVRSDLNKIARVRKWCQPCRELVYMDNAPEAVSIGIYSTQCGAASTRAARFGEAS